MIKNRKELERKGTKRSKSRRNVTKNKQKKHCVTNLKYHYFYFKFS
jgi:hypothetical protein